MYHLVVLHVVNCMLLCCLLVALKDLELVLLWVL